MTHRAGSKAYEMIPGRSVPPSSTASGINGHPTAEESREDRAKKEPAEELSRRHRSCGFALMTILAFIWIMTMHAACKQMWKQNPWLDWTLWIVPAGVNFLMLLMFLLGPTSPSGWYIVLISVFVLQFPCYMSGIALIYPQHCDFTYYTNGAKFTGGEIANFQSGAERLLRQKVSNEEFSVECGMQICLSFGTFQLCTHGARELFALLCHCSPLIFAYTFKHIKDITKHDFHITIPLLNMVDIQDFFLLLLDDNLILNFWGKDLSCEDDEEQYHLMKEENCQGNSNKTWLLILCFFWLSCLGTSYTVASIGGFVNRLPSFSCRGLFPTNDLVASPSREVELERLQASIRKARWRQAFVNLVFLDLPFLCLRLWCSYAFLIVASTLLIKNCLGMLHSLVILYCGGGPAKDAFAPGVCCGGGCRQSLFADFVIQLDEQFYANPTDEEEDKDDDEENAGLGRRASTQIIDPTTPNHQQRSSIIDPIRQTKAAGKV